MMLEKPQLHLAIHTGGLKELEQQLLRAFLEHRHADARAIVDRIAHRGSLREVGDADSPRQDSASKSDRFGS